MAIQLSDLIDPRCGRKPSELDEYVDAAKEEGYISAAAYVMDNEGTLNRENGHFLCTTCYIKAGMPSSPQGWKCP